jgi:hypothetical protein
MRVDGACHCSAVSFEADVSVEDVVICHCLDCQTMSGAPFRVHAPASMTSFQLRGEPTRYVKIGSSGAEIVTAFCAVCGSSLFSHRREDPRFVALRVGALAQRAQLAPKKQGFCDYAMPWAWNIEGVPRVS